MKKKPGNGSSKSFLQQHPAGNVPESGEEAHEFFQDGFPFPGTFSVGENLETGGSTFVRAVPEAGT
jgi:hypothetical protein